MCVARLQRPRPKYRNVVRRALNACTRSVRLLVQRSNGIRFSRSAPISIALSAACHVGQTIPTPSHAATTGARSALLAGACPRSWSTALSPSSDTRSGAVISMPIA